MTPITEERVAEIRRKLTKAQRELMLRGANGDFAMTTVRKLVDKGLWYLRIDSPNGQCGFMEPTELGTAVRAHLTGDQV